MPACLPAARMYYVTAMPAVMIKGNVLSVILVWPGMTGAGDGDGGRNSTTTRLDPIYSVWFPGNIADIYRFPFGLGGTRKCIRLCDVYLLK